jgi:hypothetical protein
MGEAVIFLLGEVDPGLTARVGSAAQGSGGVQWRLWRRFLSTGWARIRRWRTLTEATETLFFSEDRREDGGSYTPFAAVLTVGCYSNTDSPQLLGVAVYRERDSTQSLKARAIIVERLRQIVRDLEQPDPD